ncbi:MAG: hypothetical protein IKF83_01950 [Clostridia bacterium]|nr:hypothetical protein [Clostridia bacterium]
MQIIQQVITLIQKIIALLNKICQKIHPKVIGWIFMFYKLKKAELLNKNIEMLNNSLRDSNIVELVYVLGKKKEIVKRNFLAGIFRGIGIGIGVTIITAMIVIFLERLVKLNLPVIGEYITDIVNIVENGQR